MHKHNFISEKALPAMKLSPDSICSLLLLLNYIICSLLLDSGEELKDFPSEKNEPA